jgi:hypothetical protein
MCFLPSGPPLPYISWDLLSALLKWTGLSPKPKYSDFDVFVLFSNLFQMIALLRATQNLCRKGQCSLPVWTRVLLDTPRSGPKGANRLHMSVLPSEPPFAIFILGSFFNSSQMIWLMIKMNSKKTMCLFSSLAFRPLLSCERLEMYEAEAHVLDSK